jgi:RHS repeat-associated protein
MKRVLPLLLMLAAVLGRPLHGEPAQVAPGMNRYRVTVDASSTDDVPTLARQLAAMGRGRLEATPDGGDAFVVVATEAAAGVLRSDARVLRVEPLHDHTGSGVATTAATGVWATGTYVYDGAGNISSIGRTTAAIGQRFVYDAYGRLTSGMAADQKQTYTYDRFGNIRTIARGTVTGNAQSPVTTTTSTIKLGADPETNRLSLRSIGGHAMNASADYDDEGRLTAWHTSGGSYTYDALGMTTTWTGAADGKLRRYLYTPNEERLLTVVVAAGGGEVSSEWTLRDARSKVLRCLQRSGGQWSWKQDYIYLNGALLAAEVDTSAKTLHFFSDHLGTPRLITGNGGVQISRHDYLPFGEEVTVGNQDAERLRFTGHERDESALDNMHARYYSGGTGRFLSVDPGGFDRTRSQSWNRYAYVTNNPLSRVDTDGREELVIGPPRPETLARWTEAQRAAENLKNTVRAEAATRGELTVTRIEGRSTLRANWVSENGPVPSGMQVDHIIDRQLGGGDSLGNGKLLDPSVNMSNGARTANALRNMEPGTKVTAVRFTVLGIVPYLSTAMNIAGYSLAFKKEHGRVPTFTETVRYLRTGDTRTTAQVEIDELKPTL